MLRQTIFILKIIINYIAKKPLKFNLEFLNDKRTIEIKMWRLK